MLRYASAETLNFQPELVDTAAVAHGVVAELRRRYPGVNFGFQVLPYTTAAREVIQAIISLFDDHRDFS